MFDQLKKLLSQRSAAMDSAIKVRSQKWLAPGETLRIVDLDCDGEQHRLVLWNTKAGSQMLELPPARASKGAAC